MIYRFAILISLLLRISNQKVHGEKEVLFEGDIAGLTQSEIDFIHGKNNKTFAYRNVLKIKGQQWPSGIVPYKVEKMDQNYDMDYLANLQAAIDEIHENTCVRLYPKKDNQIEYLLIQFTGLRTMVCQSYIGKQFNGPTKLTLNSCNNKNVILHEMLHALGKNDVQLGSHQ